MKRQILSLAAVAIIVAGCSKNEITNDPVKPDDSSYISIDPSTGKTKAVAENDLVALKAATGGFKVYSTKNSSSTQVEYINNVVYKWSTDKWIWDATAPKWPTKIDEYPMNFYAYYPTNDGTDITMTILDKDHEITVKDLAKDQLDYLSSRSGEIVTRPASGSIPLAFKHIMSKVNFKFIVGDDMTAHIQSVRIYHVGGVGTYDFGTQTWTTVPTAFNKTYAYRTYDVTDRGAADAVAGDGTTAGALTKTDGGSLMLMPQANAPVWDAAAWKTAAQNEMADGGWAVATSELTAPTNTYIEIVYRLAETTSGTDLVGFKDFTPEVGKPGVGTTQGERFVKVAYPLNLNAGSNGTAWATQKSYTYNIYLGTPDATNGILIDHLYYYADGKRVTDGTNYHEVNSKPGEDVTPGDISFDVSVDPWTEEIGTIK